MSDANPPAIDPSLVARVKGILMQPKPEWDIIDNEYATVRSLFVPYAVLLAAIGPLAGLLGSVLFGSPSLFGAILGAALGYGFALLIVFVLSLIIDALAPSFGGVSNRVQATKVAVYASTASWVAGVFGIVPVIGGLLALLGALYSAYLLYLGLNQVMKSPADKVVLYTIVVIIIMIVISAIAALIVGGVIAGVVGGAVGMAAITGL